MVVNQMSLVCDYRGGKESKKRRILAAMNLAFFALIVGRQSIVTELPIVVVGLDWSQAEQDDAVDKWREDHPLPKK